MGGDVTILKGRVENCRELKAGQQGRKVTISIKGSSAETHGTECKYDIIGEVMLLICLQASLMKGTPSISGLYPPSGEGSYQPLRGPAGP